MAGRSFFAAAGLGRRQLQAQLAEAPEVIDAVIQGTQVRVVTATGARLDTSDLVAEIPDLVLTPTPLRFEDSFVAPLHMAPEKLRSGTHVATMAGTSGCYMASL